MPLWVLRKASILAEYGECVSARELLQNAILNIRRRLSHQSKPDLYDLSLESAMMSLQGFIAQALSSRFVSDNDSSKVDPSDERHLTLHKKYRVSWEEQNAYYVSQLEAKWEPFCNHHSESTFDFGAIDRTHSGMKIRSVCWRFLFLGSERKPECLSLFAVYTPIKSGMWRSRTYCAVYAAMGNSSNSTL